METLTTLLLLIVSAKFSMFLIYKGVTGLKKNARVEKK
jgi:hypothetical protein